MEGNDVKKGRKNKRIGRKVGNLVALMLAVSITVVVVLCVWMFYRLTMSMMEDVCVSGTNVLAYELADYDGPEDRTALLDALSEQMGCEFTIFHGNERAYTTIQQDGQRAVGTRLSDELSRIVLEQGQTYVGKASILGEDHLCSYVPTKDGDGKVDGLIFAGISMADVNRQVTFTVYLSCIIGIALIIAGIFVVGAYIKRTVSKPLFRLTVLAETLEQGNLGLEMGQNMEVSIHSNDEIGILAQSFDQTIGRLRNYIGEISHMLESIAEGDLTVQINQEYVGDFARIRSSLNDILEKLDKTIGQIVVSSESVSGGAAQMSAAAQGLSQGSVEQTGAVEELESTMEEVAGRIKQTADNAGQVQEQAGEMGRQLIESNQKMQEMVVAMEKINSSSGEIGKIIKAIEDIAFQTNILALNAAVEAARAGAAGKGFAVVSNEVRTLAGESDRAAKATRELIENSIAASEKGRRIVDEVSGTLQTTLDLVVRSSSDIGGIAEAVQHEAVSIAQVTEGISQISAVVQSNSASSEESAAVSSELFEQVRLLQEQTRRFRLKS